MSFMIAVHGFPEICLEVLFWVSTTSREERPHDVEFREIVTPPCHPFRSDQVDFFTL